MKKTLSGINLIFKIDLNAMSRWGTNFEESKKEFPSSLDYVNEPIRRDPQVWWWSDKYRLMFPYYSLERMVEFEMIGEGLINS